MVDKPKCLASASKNTVDSGHHPGARPTFSEPGGRVHPCATRAVSPHFLSSASVSMPLQTHECPENHELVSISNETELTLSCNQ
ncbi:hypothetical protein BT93_L2369 [Corymbia citriodora subsp. variegata]|uniref:Uncharacterized protein n=1 Tax=Corymbia citriodora subsp. variegata TaxID=360336 RepID=A0A8T0CJZ4_CORYI|nr:hypothetical protein BT93_L2369 [Corymbia citriodora subsp. variegata]